MTVAAGPRASTTVSTPGGRGFGTSLRAFGRANRGRRALLLVVYDGSGGHVVADLPLAAVSVEGSEVRVLLGDPARGRARSHAVWDVEAARVVRAGGRDLALRLEYAGGRTVILLPRSG